MERFCLLRLISDPNCLISILSQSHERLTARSGGREGKNDDLIWGLQDTLSHRSYAAQALRACVVPSPRVAATTVIQRFLEVGNKAASRKGRLAR